MGINEILERTTWTMRQLSDYFGIPYRTVQNWKAGVNECPDYVIELMVYKLEQEGIIQEREEFV